MRKSRTSPKREQSERPKVTRGCARGLHDTWFVRACAIEMHMDIWRWHVCAVKVIKNAAHARDYLEWTPGLNSYGMNPKCCHTVWGEKSIQVNLQMQMPSLKKHGPWCSPNKPLLSWRNVFLGQPGLSPFLMKVAKGIHWGALPEQI